MCRTDIRNYYYMYNKNCVKIRLLLSECHLHDNRFLTTTIKASIFFSGLTSFSNFIFEEEEAKFIIFHFFLLFSPWHYNKLWSRTHHSKRFCKETNNFSLLCSVANCKYTVWKRQYFSTIQILREINFGGCRS